ncbi:cytochrome P450 4C1-like [Pollicipes pollicipes]|uniref:cytochrome P450 4C1-like n=1 Tax=Pollicipes pollicipes TaxID=41117 RepID=UPI00188508C5|nr:cytochrome P450 4C1-like [Pollicipes pollicipes]XP_037080574.1 cytochrome P450 4C1-like [Pollicipes pollicipes]XP_037080575.1 cytochrome P450 4C1-like [Pollicipes pollicipes]
MEVAGVYLSPFAVSCLKGTILATAVIVAFHLKFGKNPVLAKMPHKMHPLIGNLLDMPTSLTTIIPTMRLWCEAFPGICYGYVLCFHYVIISSAEYVEPVMTSKKFLNKGLDYDSLRPWFGEGLLTSTGEHWYKHRKLLTPTFHFSILDQFLPIFNHHSQALVRALQERTRGVGHVDVWPLVANATLDAICQTAMGVEIGAQDGVESAYRNAVKEMGNIVQELSIRPWLRNQTLFKLFGMKGHQDRTLAVLHNFSRTVIEKRRRELHEEGRLLDGSFTIEDMPLTKRRLAFLDLLIMMSENGEVFSDEDIREEVDTFMFEGHDTTTSCINWALYNIARSPDVQRRIERELDDVFGGDDRAPTREDIGSLKYLECAIKESMRLFPPVTLFSRRVYETAQIREYEVPSGIDILIFPYMIHRDPNHWPDPDKFDPDRFSPEATKGRHPYSYVPFSAGLRNCIGQRFALLEVKVMVAAILRRFWVETDEKYEDLVVQMSLTIQKHGPLDLRFTPRTRTSELMRSG